MQLTKHPMIAEGALAEWPYLSTAVGDPVPAAAAEPVVVGVVAVV